MSSTGGPHGRRPTVPALPGWVLVASTLLFAVLAVLATAYEAVPGDPAVTRLVQRLPGLPPDVVADSSNLLGDPLSSSVVVLVLLALCVRRGFVQGSVFLLAMLVCWVAGSSLKLVLDSARPTSADVLVRDSHFVGTGFPSGHALTVTMFAAAVTLVLPALHRPTASTRAVVAVAWVWALGCMLSRIWLGAHWSTDVLGGFALGIALTWLSARLARSRLSSVVPR